MKRRFSSLILVAALLPFAALASYRPDLTDLSRVPLYGLPAPAQAKALNGAQPPKSAGALIFATRVDFALGLDQGLWTADRDEAVWRARLASAGAKLLIVTFDQLVLPAGAELRLYDAEGSVIQGPLTAASLSSGKALTAPLVPGEQSVIELRLPSAQRNQVRLHVSRVDHGFVDITKDGILAGHSAGTCNVDVICPEGDAWRNEIRSVAVLQIPFSDSVGACTGTLINNRRQDGKPYLLTANHCKIDSSNAASITAYWNFQTSACAGADNGKLDQNQTGTSLLFSDPGSDHTLLQLSRTPPAAYGVYYAGWNAAAVIPACGVTVHHPEGDRKSISTFGASASRGIIVFDQDTKDTSDDQNIDAWRVLWNQGTTEPGSSGSGLWDQNRYVVGVLSGGDSSCGNTQGYDYFGRLEVAWSKGLSRFLDPDGSGSLSVCGTNPGSSCNAAATPAAVCPQVTIDNGGVTKENESGGESGGGATAPAWLAMLAILAALRRWSTRKSFAGTLPT